MGWSTVLTGRGLSSAGGRAAKNGRFPHRLLGHELVSCVCNTARRAAVILTQLSPADETTMSPETVCDTLSTLIIQVLIIAQCL